MHFPREPRKAQAPSAQAKPEIFHNFVPSTTLTSGTLGSSAGGGVTATGGGGGGAAAAGGGAAGYRQEYVG